MNTRAPTSLSRCISHLPKALIALMSPLLLLDPLPVSSAALDDGQRQAMAATWGQTPISFEPNLGQAAQSVRFLARGPGYALGLGSSGATIALRGSAGQPVARLRMQLVDAATAPAIAPEDRQPGLSHYLGGSHDIRDVPNYAAVRYRNTWPGIDWRLYGNPQQLEHDFIVAPNADPAAIRLRIDGADALVIDAHGDLLMTVAGRTLRQQKPVIWQATADGHRASIDGRYRLDAAKREVAFALGDYDRSRELVIDPVLLYSTFLGGISNTDSADGIAVDASGNVYVVGQTFSIDFPLDTDPPSTPLQGDYGSVDAYVVKLNPSGSARLYATFLGGTRQDAATAVAVDASGSAYVVGYTFSSDFRLTTVPATTPLQQRIGGGRDPDGFIVKLDPAGSSRVYASYIGGNDYDQVSDVAVDSAGNAYLTGHTRSTNFPLTTVPATISLQGAIAGDADAFVVKLNAAGSRRLYASYLGGSSSDFGNAIRVAGGDAVIAGHTASADFPLATSPPSSALQSAIGGGIDGFVVRLDAAGSARRAATFVGGSQNDLIYGLALDFSEQVYIAGETRSADFPLTIRMPERRFQTRLRGSADGFFVMLARELNARRYATFLGGSDVDVLSDIAVDSQRGVHLVGSTQSADLPVSANALQPTAGSARDALYALFDASFQLQTLSYLGGAQVETGSAIAVDPAGNAWLGGITYSPNFPNRDGVQANYGGGGDAFVSRIGDGTALPRISIGDVELAEGDAGTRSMQFTVSLSAASAVPVSAFAQTAIGTATAPSDFTARSGVIDFAPGETQRLFAVEINGDTAVEDDEFFVLQLSDPVGALLARVEAIGTIANDDAAGPPQVWIEDVGSVAEGDSGTREVRFRLRLSRTAASTVRVGFYTANGSAGAGSDYVSKLSLVRFEPGEQSKTVAVKINGDTTPERDERFYGRLRGAVGATITDNEGMATIVNDD